MDGDVQTLTLMLGINVRQVRESPEQWQAFTRLMHEGRIKRVHAQGATVQEATEALSQECIDLCDEAGWPLPR